MSTTTAQIAALEMIRKISTGDAGPNAMQHISGIANAALARRPDEEELLVLAARAERERLTGKPWWDMPCKRGKCPGLGSAKCCGEPHPESRAESDQ